jgi:hypothetical protein
MLARDRRQLEEGLSLLHPRSQKDLSRGAPRYLERPWSWLCRTCLAEWRIFLRHDGMKPRSRRASGGQGSTDNEGMPQHVCRSIREPRLLSRIGPPVRAPIARSMARPTAGAAGSARPCRPCRMPEARGDRVPRRGRQCPRRWLRRSEGRAAQAWPPARNHRGFTG